MANKKQLIIATALGAALGQATHLDTSVEPFQYIKTIDGDTIKVRHTKVPNHLQIINVRLAGIDTPEMKGKCEKEKELAKKAKSLIEDKLKIANKITFNVINRDKYGRYLVIVYSDDLNINNELINQGLAYAYYGDTKRNWCE